MIMEVIYMQQSTDLQNLLHSVHRKSYPAYKSLKGSYQFDNYILSIDHVQGILLLRLLISVSGFPTKLRDFHGNIIAIMLPASRCLIILPDSLKNKSATTPSVPKAPARAV